MLRQRGGEGRIFIEATEEGGFVEAMEKGRTICTILSLTHCEGRKFASCLACCALCPQTCACTRARATVRDSSGTTAVTTSVSARTVPGVSTPATTGRHLTECSGCNRDRHCLCGIFFFLTAVHPEFPTARIRFTNFLTHSIKKELP